MNKSLKHRGPDDEGVYIDEDLSLGQVRLSILDLSPAGKQPMLYCHNKRKVCIVFNGEIYNFESLKSDLINRGYTFKSSSDTEVILASYLEYGFDCVKKFNGMWAFCIYDFNKKILFCSRDRLGVKPFNYYKKGKKFIFSSELKSILANKELKINNKKNINKSALDLYFSLGFIPSPYTIYTNVFKLEAANNLVYDLKKGKIARKWKYWGLKSYEPEYDIKKLEEEAKFLLEDAVRIRMRSDVPVGAFLSGGLDSSSVVSIMRRFTDLKKLNTFSIGFEGKYDETDYINIAKNDFKTKHHHYYYTKSDFNKMIKDYSFYYDEPFADYSGFPTIKVSELAKKKVTVVLSGDGGDEVFGGYGDYSLASKIEKAKRIPVFVRKLLLKIPLNCKGLKSFKNLLRISLKRGEEFHIQVSNIKSSVFKKWTVKRLKYCIEKSKGNLAEALRLYDVLFNTLADKYLTKVDKASMAYAVEVRSPYLDYRFYELSQRIPIEWKVNMNKNKILMKKILKCLVPEEVINRKKQGFTPPVQEWLMGEEYESFINESADLLKSLSPYYYNFYKKEIFGRENTQQVSSYKTRLFLFAKWYERWII